MSMFCYQCEQTAKGTGCTSAGVCGKQPDAAGLQDLLVHAIRGVSMYAHRARRLGARDRGIDRFVVEALFTTVTNVNFDAERLLSWVRRAAEVRDAARGLYERAGGEDGAAPPAGPASFAPPADAGEVPAAAERVGVRGRIERRGEVLAGLEELIVYGLKGTAAYVDHAAILGQEDDEVYGFFHETLDFLEGDHDAEALLGRALEVGRVNLRAMELLDRGNTLAYGHPQPTPVRVDPVAGKAICISGHDLRDLELLLEQTAGTGINVYTHGEMLPCHAYPELARHEHLVGNYGGAWQDQKREFDAFPGAILMTTNCIQKPRASYRDRIFTTGLVGFEGVAHIEDKDFTPVIEAALAADGFAQDGPGQRITVGFGHRAVLDVADRVIDAIRGGAIRHLLLVGGCDGAKSGRNYYTELVERAPADTVVLTLACGKYRFNKLDLGEIGGIPRLLDMGQCNDAHSAIRVATALAEALDTDVNSLPLSMVLSWYEQKAVCILLALLHLGIRDIRLGPTLPAFVPGEALEVLVERFDLQPIRTPEEDLRAILGG